MERYIIVRVLSGLFLLFVVIFLTVQIASGNDSPTPDEANNEQTEQIVEETDSSEERVLSEQNQPNTAVEFIIRGPIVADEEYYEIRFVVSQKQRTVQIRRGYNQRVSQSLSLANNQNAYGEFLFALQNEGFLNTRSNIIFDIPEGVCYDSRIYYYNLLVDGEQEVTHWSARCNRNLGNSNARRPNVQELFEDQFPTYNDFERSADL